MDEYKIIKVPESVIDEIVGNHHKIQEHMGLATECVICQGNKQSIFDAWVRRAMGETPKKGIDN